MKKLCMFDLDGTLMNTIGTISGYMNRALGAFGFSAFTEEEYKYFVGDGAKVLVERALRAQSAFTEENHRKVFALYNEIYNAAPNGGSAPYDGIPTLLSSLADAGVMTAVLSNKPDFATRAVVRGFFPDHAFSAVHGAREGIALKPSPEGAVLMLEELGGVLSEEVLYIGDTAVDIALGRAAGFETVGVLWGFRTREELETAGASHIVNTPDEILKIALS